MQTPQSLQASPSYLFFACVLGSVSHGQARIINNEYESTHTSSSFESRVHALGSLKLNTVSFYTITKIAVAPAVLLLEFLLLGHRATHRVIASVAVVCIGVGVCTVTDTQVRLRGVTEIKP